MNAPVQAAKALSLLDVDGHHLRQLLRLVGEAHELRTRPDRERRAHVLQGLCHIVGASAASSLLDDGFTTGEGTVGGGVNVGFDDVGRQRMLDAYYANAAEIDPALARHMAAFARSPRVSVRTKSREQLVPDREWSRLPVVTDIHGPARIGDMLHSARSLGKPGLFHSMCLLRQTGDRRFDARERNLVHLFHVECYRFVAPDPAPRRELSARQQETLRALLAGGSEKRIADQLSLSPHTVHQYVKAIYRAYGVSSRAELMALHLEP